MKRAYKYLMVIILATSTVSCNDSFLEEKPVDFLSQTNAFVTEADFDASINNLYGLVRSEFYTVSDWQPFHYLYRTDLVFEITVTTPNLIADFDPSGLANSHWQALYKIVSEANTVVSRIPTSQLSPASAVLYEARARFFRAFAYRSLVYLFGGVPLTLTEVAGEKTDFVRAGKKEVLAQIIEDLQFAATNLPAISVVRDGEVSNLVAQHLLAEVYIADGQFQNAATAASVVIDDPETSLMTSRFGSRSTVTPGDPYWDLFQVRNQNRKTSNNKEALWVIQIEPDVQGGAGSTTAGSQSGVYSLERVHGPLVRDVRVNGVAPFLFPVGDYTGGRGVGFMAPSLYFSETVWASDYNNDIRNANHNFVREFVANNPASPLFGKIISTKNPPAGATGINGSLTANKADRAFYPYQSKATTPFTHPADLYVNPGSSDPIRKYELKSGAGGTYTDQYMFRLAETYLLRAEAYLGIANLSAAAADINVVRTRAKASQILAANVDIDYILDERMREFGVEEKRMLTLMRLGKYYDRVSRLNPFYGTQMQQHFNLWPIPQPEIERNRSATLEQNPGYN